MVYILTIIKQYKKGKSQCRWLLLKCFSLPYTVDYPILKKYIWNNSYMPISEDDRSLKCPPCSGLFLIIPQSL